MDLIRRSGGRTEHNPKHSEQSLAGASGSDDWVNKNLAENQLLANGWWVHEYQPITVRALSDCSLLLTSHEWKLMCFEILHLG
jgi:hypothetical protein